MTFINKGISGDTVTDLAKRWDADVLDLQPDVLTIMVGINDFHKYVSSSKPAYSPENYGKVLYELISKTNQKLPECKIVILSPFLLPVGNTYGALYKSHLALFESYHAKSSVSGIEWIDLQKVFLDKGKKPSMAYWVWDGIHPTYSGHELITQAWLKAMGKKVKFIGRM